jgi:hypothetical protein
MIYIIDYQTKKNKVLNTYSINFQNQFKKINKENHNYK